MTNSQLFSQAHTMTKATIKAGDNYRAVFGQCLKVIKAEQAKQAVKNDVLDILGNVVTFSLLLAVSVLCAVVGFSLLKGGLAVGGAALVILGALSVLAVAPLAIMVYGTVNTINCRLNVAF